MKHTGARSSFGKWTACQRVGVAHDSTFGCSLTCASNTFLLKARAWSISASSDVFLPPPSLWFFISGASQLLLGCAVGRRLSGATVAWGEARVRGVKRKIRKTCNAKKKMRGELSIFNLLNYSLLSTN